jgi:hypothetical protein
MASWQASRQAGSCLQHASMNLAICLASDARIMANNAPCRSGPYAVCVASSAVRGAAAVQHSCSFVQWHGTAQHSTDKACTQHRYAWLHTSCRHACACCSCMRAADVSAWVAPMQLQQDAAEDVPVPTVNHKHPGETCAATVLDKHPTTSQCYSHLSSVASNRCTGCCPTGSSS